MAGCAAALKVAEAIGPSVISKIVERRNVVNIKAAPIDLQALLIRHLAVDTRSISPYCRRPLRCPVGATVAHVVQ